MLGFRSSSNLASAYGIAVTGTLAIDTILAFVVVRMLWQKPLWIVLVGAVFFLTVDLAFFAANTTKIVHGGWFPLVVAALVFLTLTTWRRGRVLVAEQMREGEIPLDAFLARVANDPPVRVDGTAVFLTATGAGTPRALMHNVEHNHVLHRHVVLFTAATVGSPRVPDEERLTITDLGHGFARVHASYGFQEDPVVPDALRLARDQGLELDVEEASYFLNHITLLATGRARMARWRKRLFVGMTRNANSAARFFQIPSDQIVELGTQVEL